MPHINDILQPAAQFVRHSLHSKCSISTAYVNNERVTGTFKQPLIAGMSIKGREECRKC